MHRPTIGDATRLANEHRASIGCIVLTFDAKEGIAGASYGHTRKTCDFLRELLDAILDGIVSGQLTGDQPSNPNTKEQTNGQ